MNQSIGTNKKTYTKILYNKYTKALLNNKQIKYFSYIQVHNMINIFKNQKIVSIDRK